MARRGTMHRQARRGHIVRYLRRSGHWVALGGIIVACCLALVVLSGCSGPQAQAEDASAADDGRITITLGPSAGFDDFIALVERTYPDIHIERSVYAGANKAGYVWHQMRADDIPDLFISNIISDPDILPERLVDLTGYGVADGLSTALLDEVEQDGSIYMVPVATSMYGIVYNKSLMEDMGWEVPRNFAELEELCTKIREAGLTPGVLSSKLTGNPFSVVFNLAKTTWLSTLEGNQWVEDFLAGDATAAGRWEETMAYVQRYVDLGMLESDPEDRGIREVVEDYLGGRRAVFAPMSNTLTFSTLENGDELGLMPYLSESGDKNIYMHNPFTYMGISKHLTDEGNEERLDAALRVISLLFSPEGQATFLGEDNPFTMSSLSSAELPQGSPLEDAKDAMGEGLALPMTYVGWEGTLADIGAAFKAWFRGEPGASAETAIAAMDELQTAYLANQEADPVSRCTEDLSIAETARVVAASLGAAADADAAAIPYADGYHDGTTVSDGVSARLYAGTIITDVCSAIAPGNDGPVCVVPMTGAELRELAEGGYDVNGVSFPWAVVTRDGSAIDDEATYSVALSATTCEKAGVAGEELADSVWTAIPAFLKGHSQVDATSVTWD